MKKSGIIVKSALVKSKFGMHVRPAYKIAKIARTAKANVWFYANFKKVNAANADELLTLCAVKGTQILIQIENQKDIKVLDKIISFFKNGFGEIYKDA